MRWGMVLGLLVLPCLAGGDKSLRGKVDEVLGELKEKVQAARPKELNEENWAAWQAAFEVLRAEAAAKVEDLARKHGPGGEEDSLDIVPACEALLRAPLVPRGRKAWTLALRVLRLDTRSPDNGYYLQLLRDHVVEEHADEPPPWRELERWARDARVEEGVDGEAALALDVFRARCTYDMGDKKAARQLAQAVLGSGRGSKDVRRAAAEVVSLSSVLVIGKEAPAFRIRSLDGKREYVLEEWRGRCVLLHFQHLVYDDFDILKVVEGAKYDHPGSELKILTIPLGDDTEAIELLRQNADALEWPTATPGETAGQIGKAYGIEGISALYLVSPDGKILANGGWDLAKGPERIDELVRAAVGPPIEESLRAVAGTPTWHVFREFWHGLVARGRTEFEPATWEMARKLGRRAVDALLLASAKPAKGPLPAAVDLHSRIAEAWHKKGDAWEALLGGFSNPRSDRAFELVDALFDLGLPAPELREHLEKTAQRANDWRAVSMALRCLEFQDCDLPPRPVKRLQRSRTWQVRLALAEGLRAYRHKESVDLLIALLGDKRLRVRAAAVRSLERLTGELLGTSQKSWAEWRREQGADLRFPPREINRYAPYKQDAHKYAHRGYYGLQIASSEVVFVLDKSDSMYYGLFDGVVEEMQAHLASAGPTTRFNVIEFAGVPIAWQKDLVAAHAANLRDAVNWLHRSMPYGPTNIIDSLRMALATPGLDSIVLLSDGFPNRGEPATAKGILEAVQKENRYNRVAIHTVLLLEGRVFPHDGPRGKDVPPLDDKEKERRRAVRKSAESTELGSFLKQLALDNDGTFGVGFADAWMPPPGASTRPSTDK